MLDWIIEGLRWIVWGFTAACLELMDVCYDLITKIASADFLSSKEVWSWYYSLMAFLGVLIFIRFFSVFLKVSFDEEFREKFSGVQVFNKIIAIGLVIGLLPMIVGGISNISVNGIKNISVLVGSSSIKEPSTFLITSFMNTDNGEFNEDGTWVEGNQTTYTLEDVDINEEGEDDDYKFFNAIQDLFIMALLGVAASIMLIINGIQIGKRMFSLVMKILVAPLPISSMIVPGDETFTMWRKMIISDYLMNFVQTLMIMVVMILSSSTFVRQFGLWVQIIMFIAGLLLLLSGIPELAKILGGDTSQANILQQIASFRMATRGVGHSLGKAAGAIGTAGTGIAAGGAYATGRMLGGKSIWEMNASKTSNQKNGFMGGAAYNNQNNQGYTYADQAQTTNQHHVDDNMVHSSLNQSNQQGFTSQSNEGVNQGIFQNNAFEQEQMRGNPFSSPNQMNAQGQTGSNPFSSSSQQEIGNNNAFHTAKEGSIARNFNDYVQNKPGIAGYAGRFAANSSRHIYQASARRLANNNLYKAGSFVRDLGQVSQMNAPERKDI